MNRLFVPLFFLLLFAGPVVGQYGAGQFGGDPPGSPIEVSLQVDRSSAAPGETVYLVVELVHPPGWNTYWINPGTGLPTTFDWKLPAGFRTGTTLWPIPQVKDAGEFGTSHIYEGTVQVITPLEVPETAGTGAVNIGLEVSWMECNANGCRQAGGTYSVDLGVGDSATPGDDLAGKVAAVQGQQARRLDAWTVETGGSPTVFELRLTPGEGANAKPGSLYFFESSPSPALEYVMPEVFREEDVWVLRMPKSEEVDSALVEGFVHAENGWLSDGEKAPALAVIPTRSAPVSSGGTEPPVMANPFAETPETVSPGEKAGAGALYDVDARPDFVLLSGEEEQALTLLPALGLVFIGGLLLNLMPCVFPVLGLKVMGFVSQAGARPEKVKRHGMVFGFGVVVSMWILSGIIIALGLDWGAQLQNPPFVAGIVILLFLMGLNMAGVFEFGTSMVSVGGELQAKEGYSGSFFSGVLTTLIATPCSGPFLGSVMGFALSQAAPIAFLVFTFFAMGIASPYVVLSFFPDAINRLPRPGQWMELFKKGMSFALFGTAVFFLGTFTRQTGTEGASWLLFALVVIGLSAWIYGTWGTPLQPKRKRLVVGYGVALGVALLGLQMTRVAAGKEAPALAASEEWKPWFPGVMELSRSKKRIAWIDYTAEW